MNLVTAAEGGQTQERRRQCEDVGGITVMWPQIQACWWPPETEGTRKELALGASEGTQPCHHPAFELMILILVMWPPKLQENNFLLFSATKLVIICHSSQL